MKTVLFIPGFRETIDSRDYTSVIHTIERKGYKVQFVAIKWTRTTIENWTKELQKEYAKHDPAQIILAGFSYGAMTAFMAAAAQNPSALWLFSFSPYFADDLPDLKKAWLAKIGHRRVDAFRKLDFNTLAKNITCKTLIFFGNAEHPLIDRRAERAQQSIVNSALVVVEGAGHDVAHKNYVAAIEKSIG